MSHAAAADHTYHGLNTVRLKLTCNVERAPTVCSVHHTEACQHAAHHVRHTNEQHANVRQRR